MIGIAGLQHPLMQATGLATLHSLWQGILLYCVFKLVLAFVPEQRSALRYRISYATLGILFLLFLYTFGSEAQLAYAALHDVTAHPGYVHLAHSGAATGSLWQVLFSPMQLALIDRIVPWIAVLYALGVAVLCAKMIRELLQLRYLRRQVMLPESLLQHRFLELKTQAGIGKEVLLRLSERVQVPLMLGHLKPIILLPLSLAARMDAQQLETILLHELAHIRRNDYLWNILQMVMETLLFFNPVAWMLSSVIREEREHCCDAYVMRRSKAALPYAHALLAMEEYRLNGYAMAATGNKKSLLLNRIKRITAMKTSQRSSQRTLATLTILVLFAAMVCFVSAFGQSKKEENKPSAKPITKTYSRSYSKNTVTVIDDKGNVKTYNSEDGDTTGMAEAMSLAHDALDKVNTRDIHKQVTQAMALASQSMDNVDWDQMERNIKNAMKSVDWNKVQSDVNKAMKDVDWEKMQEQVDKAMKNIDWDDVNAKIDKAHMEARRQGMQASREAMEEARKAMKEVDWDQIRGEMAKAKAEIARAMDEAHTEMQLNGADMDEVRSALQDAKEDIRRAKREMKKAMEEKQDAEDSQVD